MNPRAAGGTGAERHRVLLVEDEWLLADQLADTLDDLGYAVIGPVPTVRQALALIDEEPPEAAVLDISLRDEKSYRVAEELSRRGIPFLFLTGYINTDLPAPFRGSPLLRKPATVQKLEDELTAMFEG